MSHTRTIEPEEVLVTDRLYLRSAREASLGRELDAYRELSALMAVDPVLAIQRFLDLSVELCPAAGSAGLSELVQRDEREQEFRWTAMSGAFASYVGGTTPRDFSPCGLCLDNHHTILVERPGRVFTYFDQAEPTIYEGLVVPLYDTGKRPLGTLWVTSHEAGAQFDPTDVRIMEQLAVQLVLALKLRRKSRILAQLEETARDNALLVQEVRHRVKNMIQMTSALLRLQERAVRSGEARVALQEAQSRLLVLASVYEALLLPNADARQVDVAALIEALGGALRETSACGREVRLRTDCDRLMLGVGAAVPLGLLVNEAVTNAFKHGFGEADEGTVVVRLTADGGRGMLSVADDGRGFDGPLRQGSLGMRLMKSLARQLKGKLHIDGSAGTTVRLEFPLATPVDD